MRAVILSVNITLDGFLAGHAGELDWMLPDPAMNQAVTDSLRERVDTILVGRNAYLGFERNFRAQAVDPASPPELVDFAEWMIRTPKVVFSNTLHRVSEVSRLATANIPDTVAALKAQPGADVVVFGGVDTARQFVEHRVVDEYWLKVYPVALGRGQPLFPDDIGRTHLALIDSQPWESGIITARYRAANPVPPRHRQ
jgi:dihydrofolate reductase